MDPSATGSCSMVASSSSAPSALRFKSPLHPRTVLGSSSADASAHLLSFTDHLQVVRAPPLDVQAEGTQLQGQPSIGLAGSAAG